MYVFFRDGKKIELKDEDTDIESTKKNRYSRQRKQFRRRRNTGKKDTTDTDVVVNVSQVVFVFLIIFKILA